MESKLDTVPAKLERLVAQIAEVKSEYDTLLQLKPKRDMVCSYIRSEVIIKT